MIGQRKQERPSALRSSIVDRYVRQILNPKDSEQFKKNVRVVKMMIDLQLDNRVLNNMRQQMNERVNESGLLGKEEFKKMFTMFHGSKHLD